MGSKHRRRAHTARSPDRSPGRARSPEKTSRVLARAQKRQEEEFIAQWERLQRPIWLASSGSNLRNAIEQAETASVTSAGTARSMSSMSLGATSARRRRLAEEYQAAGQFQAAADQLEAAARAEYEEQVWMAERLSQEREYLRVQAEHKAKRLDEKGEQRRQRREYARQVEHDAITQFKTHGPRPIR